MTELELYSDKLLEALTDTNPVMLLRRIRNNATMAVALAEANSILTEADKFATRLATSNVVITTAVDSRIQERLLSFMCLQKLAELYKHTYAYRQGFLDESCMKIHQLDQLSIKKLCKLSTYLKENITPLLQAIKYSNSRIVKQHVMRKMLTALDQVR